jgi:hypothetical protein
MRFVTARHDTNSNVCQGASNVCHPEPSLAESEANRQTQSKDPGQAGASTGSAGSFRTLIRFFDEQGAELFPGSSREAAKECSPRRKPWVSKKKLIKPRRGERSGAGTL